MVSAGDTVYYAHSDFHFIRLFQMEVETVFDDCVYLLNPVVLAGDPTTMKIRYLKHGQYQTDLETAVAAVNMLAAQKILTHQKIIDSFKNKQKIFVGLLSPPTPT